MISILVDTSPAKQFLNGLHTEQIPFAASRAVNQTAKDVQLAERRQLGQAFILRARTFLERSILIPRFSDKRDQPIRVDVVVGRRAAFVWKFETGAPKVARSREQPVAIPTSVLRPQRSALVPLSMFPKNLRLVARRDVKGILAARRHVTARGVVQLKGKQRTFVLDPTQHFGVRTWGVYQRTGPGRGDIRLIWAFRERIRTPQVLRFVEVALQTIRGRWPEHFAQSFAQAARTAHTAPPFRTRAA